VKRITSRQIAGRDITRTVANTRERQDLLEKVSTSGQFFQVTSGGAVLNSADMLLARERKHMRKEAEEQERLKESKLAYSKAMEVAKKVFTKKYKKWTIADYKVAITYKRGPSPPKDEAVALSGKSAQFLKRLYERKYKGARRPTTGTKWTSEEEARLQKCIRGDIDSVKEPQIYGRALETQNQFLSTKLETMSTIRRRDVLAKLFGGLADDEKKDIVRLLLDTNVVLDSSEEDSGSSDDGESFATELESDEDDDILLDQVQGDDSNSHMLVACLRKKMISWY
jgi:hypothetical protein